LQTVYKCLPKTTALSVKRVSGVELCESSRRAGPAAAAAEWRTLLRKIFRILCNMVDNICCLKKCSVSLVKGIWVEYVCVMECFVDVERTLR
jgi:hypothetical protein